MSPSFTLIVIVVGAYLAAHVAFGWIARRYLIVSGAEYLLLGILLGPQVSGVLSASVFDGFAPFMTLALGWIGALIGAQFFVPDLIRFGTRPFRVAFFEAGFSGLVIFGGMLLVFVWLFPVPLEIAIAPAIVAGAIGVVTSPAGIGLVAQRLVHRKVVVQQLQLTAGIDAVVAITAFSLLLVVDHVQLSTAVRPLTATEWGVISITIGCVGGALFHLFLGRETKLDRLFISLLGAIMLASGAAAYLRLSPLLPCMLIGAILINTSSNRAEIRKALSTLERPIYFVLLIFAGAAWAPSGRMWLIAAIAFVGLRVLAKLTGARAAAAWNGAAPALGSGWGRALLGQGGLAVAIALNYMLHDRSVLANVVFAAALVSVLLTDLTSARLAENVVRASARDLNRPESSNWRELFSGTG